MNQLITAVAVNDDILQPVARPLRNNLGNSFHITVAGIVLAQMNIKLNYLGYLFLGHRLIAKDIAL